MINKGYFMSLTPILDHAVINVDDHLDYAYALFCRMGFQLSARGHHSMGSSNHLAIFGENYLELLGYEPSKDRDERGLWTAPLGLAGLVWKTEHAHETYRFVWTACRQLRFLAQSHYRMAKPPRQSFA
jgi:hypothetical protein